MGLDAGSREVLLDLIYRLSLDDKASDGKARAPGDGAAKERHRKERSGDDEDDEARRLRARAKEARREEREREKKEKVLHKALKEDRRAERRDKASGGVGPDDDDDPNRHPHLLDRPKPAGEKIAVTVTCASGETKLLQIARAGDLESLFRAARSKFKAMKKAPNVARMHAPPGPTIDDSLSLAPGAVVFVDFEKEKEKKKEKKKETRSDPADDPNAETVVDAGIEPARASDGAVDESTDAGAASPSRRAPTLSDEGSGANPEAVAAENKRLLAAVTSRRRAFGGETKHELPAHRARDEIVRAIEQSGSPVTLLAGETGSGKTTQAPMFVLEHYAANGRGADANVLVAQPRRVAAVSVARRVAEEFGEPVGETVGYAVRGDARVCPRRTRVTFVTTGVLLRRLARDPTLRGVSHVFVDEIHERTADADFLLAHLRDVLVDQWFAKGASSPASSPEGEKNKLRVVLMSATMASATLREYFASSFPKSAPSIPTPHIEGRAFPVEERFAEAYVSSSEKKTRTFRRDKNDIASDAFEKYSRALLASLPPVLAELEAQRSHEGHSSAFPGNGHGACLVFLPGAPEIDKIERVLKDSLPNALFAKLHVAPLHGRLSVAEQRRAFEPAPKGLIKMVLATNVAETSLTIPDVVAVFDSGRSKKLLFDPKRQISSLKEGWCSLASAAQRKGRAGRVRPGVCVRLYTSNESAANQPTNDAPEISTMPLESLVMHAMLTRPERDPETTLASTPDPPPPEAVRAATARLKMVGAVAEAETAENENARKANSPKPKLVLTPLGAHLAHLPVEPRLGKMLVYACVLGCLPPILTAAAAMSCKPAFGVDPADKDAAVIAKRSASRRADFGARSDQLAVAAAFDAWSFNASDPHTKSLRLNRAAMRDIAREREALKKKLRESGFEVDSLSARANEANDDVARCVLAAGLFPNVARVRRGELRAGKTNRNAARGRSVVLDARGAEVAVHPGGVNGYQGGGGGGVANGGPPEGFLVYQEAVETSRVFLRDTTAVSIEALLLFGGDISVNHSAATVSVSVGGVVGDAKGTGKMDFPAAPEVGVLFKLLRRELDRALRVAAADPGAEQASLQGTPEGRRLMDVLLRLFPGGSMR